MESIQSTIASFQIMLNQFDCHKTTWPLSVTLFIQIQLIILFLGTKVHQHQKMLENKFIVVCSKKQKFLKQQKFWIILDTIEFSGI